MASLTNFQLEAEILKHPRVVVLDWELYVIIGC